MDHDLSALPKPPSTASGLIRTALADLELAESPGSGYDIDMQIWHEPRHMAGCTVCLAGSVMAYTIGMARNEDGDRMLQEMFRLVEDDCDERVGAWYQSLLALDKFAQGRLRDAATELEAMPRGGDVWNDLYEAAIASRFDATFERHEDDPAAFKAALAALADALEARGC